jgi:hypothetical protein
MFNISQGFARARAPLVARVQSRNLSIFDYFKKKTEADVQKATTEKASKSMIEQVEASVPQGNA